MEYIDCIICSKGKLKYLFSKYSGNSELFKLVKCLNCGLEFISPRPAVKEITKYYELEYFSNRTDRGYDNYFSKKARDEIERVFVLNLGDLDFFEFESNIKGNKAGLDIGCAAGYFVNFLQNRNWESFGIDVSLDCVKFAQKNNLKVEHDDYLKYNFGKKFNLVTLWASIEHLHYPGKFLKKIHKDLLENGMLYISTCRTGTFSFKSYFKKNWRFYNFPEHLFFFTYRSLKKILEQNGFRVIKLLTYGSGFGKPGSLKRKIADFAAKRFYIGDMMIIAAEKKL